ncbi:MAG TPA: AAA family ATPase [Allosphingosinicella sp.]|jgi:SpoVK/Ycf46/Vps4 family AAA+-type ATPase
MGEKLLAQRVLTLLRETSGRSGAVAPALVDWANDKRDWLWPDVKWAACKGEPKRTGKRRKGKLRLDWDGLPALAAKIATDEPDPDLFGPVDALARLLALEPFEHALLRAAVGMDRFPRLSTLRQRLLDAGQDMLPLLGRVAGAGEGDAAARVRRSALVSLGLVRVEMGRAGGYRLEFDWTFSSVLDRGLVAEERLVDALAGVRQKASLTAEDFAERRESFDLIARLLGGALRARAAGVNVLIYGPPGTGKTELARTLAAAAGADLYAVGEADEDGDEPTRWERIHALKRAQRLLSRRTGALLLFDEMEDLFSDARTTAGDGAPRAGSKIFVNRLLEENPVPTLWTSNAIGDVDPAHLRRMSFVLKMDHPPARARARIARRIAEAEGTPAAADALAPLLEEDAEAASIARAAIRAAALAAGAPEDAEAVGRALLTGLRGGRAAPPRTCGAGLDLGLYEADVSIEALLERLCAPGAASDFSLLLTGPPGTGKTALAAHLAHRLDRPLSVKRTSDLLSKWVGGTEANIAEAFAEAREEGAVLLFDEADSLLLDRSDAQRSWEITQVNELLTWMDSHTLPFVAATNFARRLDPAALRRFVFKIDLRAMSEAAAARAFERFFGAAAPAGLREIPGLTPGDFAVVKRQLRYRRQAAPADIVALLAAEAKAKPERPLKIGF